MTIWINDDEDKDDNDDDKDDDDDAYENGDKYDNDDDNDYYNYKLSSKQVPLTQISIKFCKINVQ